jgi:hypothetical protein
MLYDDVDDWADKLIGDPPYSIHIDDGQRHANKPPATGLEVLWGHGLPARIQAWAAERGDFTLQEAIAEFGAPFESVKTACYSLKCRGIIQPIEGTNPRRYELA